MWKKIFRTKNLMDLTKEQKLAKVLSSWDLIALGIGSTLGTGVFVLTGMEAAKNAGPAVAISFIFAGITAGLAALSYAELASMIPVSGSSYTYAYIIIGEFIAWLVGWNLILEYAVSLAAVATGWSAYVRELLSSCGMIVPSCFASCPNIFGGKIGGGIDFFAALITIIAGWLLSHGVKNGAKSNNFMVLVKITTILFFVVLAAPSIDITKWHPFMPFGFKGVITAASILFFSYLGFDTVSTSAEECKNPQKSLPIGILGTLIICSLLYVCVSLILTGVVPYTQLNTAAPVGFALNYLGYKFGSTIIIIGILFGLTSIILATLYGQTRIFFAMARDGLIPKRLCTVNEKYKTPNLITWITSIFIALLAALAPIDKIVEMSNIGTYFAFITTSIAVLGLRIKRPDIKRGFRCPGVWVVSILAIAMCFYFSGQLVWETWIRFILWSIIGIIIYFSYGYTHSEGV